MKRRLCEAPILCHFDPFKKTRLETDSSDGVVSGVLMQLQDDGIWHPAGSFSEVMSGAELNYGIAEK